MRPLAIGTLTLFIGVRIFGVDADDAHAATLKVLHSFCTRIHNDSCSDGTTPGFGSLFLDSGGNLFGVTPDGGKGKGVLFELVAKPHDKWDFVARHHFCTGHSCKDGAGPDGPLIQDIDGNLYGTTTLGGNGYGVVYEITPDPSAKQWHVTTLFEFCKADPPTCTMGDVAVGGVTYQGEAQGLPYDGISPLFGVTIFGGKHGAGVVYAIAPSGHPRWKETVLYNFCAKGGDKCTDGHFPRARPILDASGNLYGTTDSGGTLSGGVVYRLTPRERQWDETVLYRFCSQPNCTDGANTVAGVVMDSSGALSGVTYGGGANTAGVLYKLTPDGNKYDYADLHDFCSQLNCQDGGRPSGTLIEDPSGNFYGTALNGGLFNAGTIFMLGNGGYQVLYDFCKAGGCADGSAPDSGLIRDASGNLFGTTSTGGDAAQGTVFEFTP